LKLVSNNCNMTWTAVEAPGEAPSKADIEPSSLVTSSVPNLSVPFPPSSVSLITCTRWPAITMSQSSNFAVGINSFNSSNRFSSDKSTCSTKYFVNPISFNPAESIVKTLLGLTDSIKSKFEPVFKNLGENPAKGPNNNVRLPSMYLVSKCGTDIGGAPTLALP